LGQSVPALQVRRLSKQFGGVRALDDVTLTVLPGEVHGLLGQNGSGKSTLIKILAGYHAPSAGGELFVNGLEVKLPLAPGEARELGISFVHQDLGLFPSLTALENLRAAAFVAPKRRWYISWRRELRTSRESLARFGVDVDLEARVADLAPVDRARLAIVRAIETLEAAAAGSGRAGGGLLVLDEPTAFLPRARIDQLFALVRKVVAEGASVLFVSHDLDEVREITDRVTVLRDGRVHGTVATSEATTEVLVEMIIGRSLASETIEHRSNEEVGAAQLAIESVSGGSLDRASLELRAGEVLGLTGLIGSGFEDVPYLVYGSRRGASGMLVMGRQAHDLAGMTPARARRLGIALVPADRQADGVIGSLAVIDNVMQPVLGSYGRLRLALRRMLSDSRTLLRRFGVRPPEPNAAFQELSGGNQQKALLAKWLQTAPALLFLHEPTQGVDVGAREQILGLIRAAARDGAAVVCASTDHEQLANVCDRVLVFHRGRVAGELSGLALTKQRIAERTLNPIGA
jgi:ribose transport system ATP-binding protein